MEGFLNPSEVLKKLELRKDMVAADFGSGSGGWVIPLAKVLEKGKVYAIDILEEPLSALEAKIKSAKISNTKTIRADVESGSNLSDNSCDLVLMTNLLFEVEDIKKVLKEGKRVLKERGKILVVDWKKETPFGPKSPPLAESRSAGEKVLPEKIKEIAKEIGLELEKEFEAGIYHWGLLLKKSP